MEKKKWIITTDEFETVSQETDSEQMAYALYEEALEERKFSGDDHRVYLAEVVMYEGGPSAWKRGEDEEQQK